ncbi:hypothetical protein MSPP1_003661 [Malassezia sp. CBS 17886]|nr:hypothetical protein MSPP1_003661 [Malassezia sp. CBS 17886]
MAAGAHEGVGAAARGRNVSETQLGTRAGAAVLPAAPSPVPLPAGSEGERTALRAASPARRPADAAAVPPSFFAPGAAALSTDPATGSSEERPSRLQRGQTRFLRISRSFTRLAAESRKSSAGSGSRGSTPTDTPTEEQPRGSSPVVGDGPSGATTPTLASSRSAPRLRAGASAGISGALGRIRTRTTSPAYTHAHVRDAPDTLPSGAGTPPLLMDDAHDPLALYAAAAASPGWPDAGEPSTAARGRLPPTVGRGRGGTSPLGGPSVRAGNGGEDGAVWSGAGAGGGHGDNGTGAGSGGGGGSGDGRRPRAGKEGSAEWRAVTATRMDDTGAALKSGLGLVIDGDMGADMPPRIPPAPPSVRAPERPQRRARIPAIETGKPRRGTPSLGVPPLGTQSTGPPSLDVSPLDTPPLGTPPLVHGDDESRRTDASSHGSGTPSPRRGKRTGAAGHARASRGRDTPSVDGHAPPRARASPVPSSGGTAAASLAPMPAAAVAAGIEPLGTRRSNTSLGRLFRASSASGEEEDAAPRIVRPPFRRRRSSGRTVSAQGARAGSPAGEPAGAPASPAGYDAQLVPPVPPFVAQEQRLPEMPNPYGTPQLATSVGAVGASASETELLAQHEGRALRLSPSTPTLRGPNRTRDEIRKRELQRQNVLRELVDTERTYAADLAVVKGLYLAQARQRAGIRAPSTPSLTASSLPGAAGGAGVQGARPDGVSPPLLPRTMSSLSSHSSTAGPEAVVHPLSPTARTNRSSLQSFTSADSDVPPQLTPAYEARGAGTAPLGAWDARGAPLHAPRAPHAVPLSVTDIHVIFAGVEACAALAAEMHAALEGATAAALGRPDAVPNVHAGYVGEVFLARMHMIEQVYTLYCARHEAAMTRLNDVTLRNPAAAAFLRECDETSREHSNAWNLSSLLIKPVQRVLKYPLFLHTIIACTDAQHPDCEPLRAALAQIQGVADRINENKKRMDVVERHGFLPPHAAPRTAGFFRPPGGARRARAERAADGAPLTVDDERFRVLVAQLAAQEQQLVAFAQHCAGWIRALRHMYATEVRVLREWAAVYRSGSVAHAALSLERVTQLSALLEHVVVHGVCEQVDLELRHTVYATVRAVQQLFERPKMVIANRAAKEGEYRRYLHDLARRPHTKPGTGASAFHSLHVQLVEELPALLRGTDLIMERCVLALARIQSACHAVISEELRAYCARYVPAAITPTSGGAPWDDEHDERDEHDPRPPAPGATAADAHAANTRAPATDGVMARAVPRPARAARAATRAATAVAMGVATGGATGVATGRGPSPAPSPAHLSPASPPPFEWRERFGVGSSGGPLLIPPSPAPPSLATPSPAPPSLATPSPAASSFAAPSFAASSFAAPSFAAPSPAAPSPAAPTLAATPSLSPTYLHPTNAVAFESGPPLHPAHPPPHQRATHKQRPSLASLSSYTPLPHAHGSGLPHTPTSPVMPASPTMTNSEVFHTPAQTHLSHDTHRHVAEHVASSETARRMSALRLDTRNSLSSDVSAYQSLHDE